MLVFVLTWLYMFKYQRGDTHLTIDMLIDDTIRGQAAAHLYTVHVYNTAWPHIVLKGFLKPKSIICYEHAATLKTLQKWSFKNVVAHRRFICKLHVPVYEIHVCHFEEWPRWSLIA